MFRKYVLPILAIVGVGFGIVQAVNATRKTPPVPPVVQPAPAAFPSSISGAGIVEPSTEDIKIGTLVPGVVAHVHVAVGDRVSKGDPLFLIDDRDRRAGILVRRAQVQVNQAQLERLKRWPRPEEIPPLEAKVKEAQAAYDDLSNQYHMVENIRDKRAISVEEVDRRRQAMLAAEARLTQARAELDVLRAGTWQADLEVAAAQLAAAQAQLQADEVELERLTVRSPIDGEVLRVNLRAGEYAAAGALANPLMVLGNLDRLHVRVDIDENDAWRFNRDARAVAFVRGNRELRTELRFVRVEPYVVPKRSLTGDTTERVDTRVLQVLYSFERSKLPVFVGQQMDVYIEAPPITATTTMPQGSAAER